MDFLSFEGKLHFDCTINTVKCQLVRGTQIQQLIDIILNKCSIVKF